jgi:arabinogalactan endo-1,4-beta-galactosidase
MNIKSYFLFFLFSFFFLSACKKEKEESKITPLQEDDFTYLRGADVSFIPEIRDHNFIAKNSANENEDMLYTLRKAGVNVFRIRIWVNPSNQYSSFNEVKALAEEIKSTKARVWLTVHYSDTWADPGNQQKPTRWLGKNVEQLKDSVYEYTKKIVLEIKPDYIQIGNEINNGLLWPEGSYNYVNQFKSFLSEGIRAVREHSINTKIMLHYAGHKDAVYFFEKFKNLDFDIIGISYYPKWHGKNLDSLQSNLNLLSSTYNKQVIIAETSYPFTFSWNDWTNNVIGSQEEILPNYLATELGQKYYLQKIREIAENTNNGMGFCYWGAEWVSFKGNTAQNGSSYENQAFWDFNGKALPVMEVYKK